MAPLIALNALIALYAFWGEWTLWLAVVGASVPLTLPGAGLCWFKHARFLRRFGDTMVRSAYGEMKHELSAARQIHDAMFPAPITDGPVRVDYRYEPMRQIGGDYVFARRDDQTGRVDVVLIDVTGHGVGAALAVNRLHGEVERLLSQSSATGPGALIDGLNRYLYVTMATHSVYATALALRIDPNDNSLTYASAGHPPALLVRPGADAPRRLDSTAFLLGVCPPADFEAGEETLPLVAGERVIAFTDGATEALDAGGRQLRLKGLERTIRGLDAHAEAWTGPIARAVEAHRSGAPTDDVLIVDIRRV